MCRGCVHQSIRHQTLPDTSSWMMIMNLWMSSWRNIQGFSSDYIQKSSENSEEITLQHDIRLYTDAYDRHLSLLSHWETVNLKYWRKSLFSEGIFSLKSGDRLKVWSKNLNLIDVGGTISQKTAFVAYPLFSTWGYG